MVALRRQLLLLCLLLLLPVATQARLTLGWVPGAAILGSEDQARRLAAHLESRLAAAVVLRSCASETQLHEWMHRYRMVDLAPFSENYLRQLPAGQLLPVADVQAGSVSAQMVLRQGLRSDQQQQLRGLLVGLPEEPAGRDLLATLGGLQFRPHEGAPRAAFGGGSPTPAPPVRKSPPTVLWPDEIPAADVAAAQAAAVAPAPVVVAPSPPAVASEPRPSPPPQPVPLVDPSPGLPQQSVAAVAPSPTQPEPEQLPEPPAVATELGVPSSTVPATLAGPGTAVAALAQPGGRPELSQAPAPAPEPKPLPKVAALPKASPPMVPPPQLPGEAVSRSLSSGRQPLADGAPLETIYLVPFTTIMVPQPVAEAVFDQFVETLNENGGPAGYQFVILKDELEQVDPTWLRKATYVTGEIFGYVEESGCCSTDIRSKSRLALYRPGASEPKMRHEYPAKAFFDHDYSTIEAERKKLAERISLDLSRQLLKALGGG